MKTIYKYALGSTGLINVFMPDYAQPLHVGMQNGVPHVWALVDEAMPIRPRRFLVVGTGWDITTSLPYIGTAHNDSGLVWHVFDGWYAESEPREGLDP